MTDRILAPEDVYAMLRWLARKEADDCVRWVDAGEGLTCVVGCNDFFAPAADAEELWPEDLQSLGEAIDDCRNAGGCKHDPMFGMLLWVARKRATEPWRNWWRKSMPSAGIISLFEAAAKGGTNG